MLIRVAADSGGGSEPRRVGCIGTAFACLVVSLGAVPGTSLRAEAEESSDDEEDDPPVAETTAQRPRPVDEPRQPSGWATNVPLRDRPAGEEDVASALEEVPGLSVRRSSSLGQPAHVEIRGGNPRQTATMLNGIRIGSPAGRGFDFGGLASHWLSSVEVYRGAAATPWGAGPLTGAVNLRTSVREEPGWGTSGTMTLGSFSTWGLHGHAEGAGSAGGLRFDAGWRQGRGDFSFVDEQGSEHVRINNDHRQLTLATTAGTEVAGGRATGTVVYEDRRRGAPGPGEFQEAYRWAETSIRRGIATANWKRRGVAAGEWGALDLRLAAGGVARRHAYENPEAYLGSVEWESTSDEATVSAVGRADLFFAFGNLLHLTLETRRADYRARYGSGEVEWLARGRTTLGMGLSDELLLFDEQLSLIAGVRVDHLRGDRTETPVVPSGGVVWRALPWLDLKGNVARTVRPPDLDELYLRTETVRGNPDLESERSLNWDAGVELGDESWPIRGRAAWFEGHVRRTILFLPQTAYLYRAENVSDALSRGIELQLEGEVDSWIRARGQYTWNRAQLNAGPAVQLPGRPRHAGRVSTGFDAAGLGPFEEWRRLELTAKVRARSGVNLDNFGRLRNPAYAALDLGLEFAPGRRYEIGVTLSNVTDHRRIRDRFQRPLPGRALYASFRLRDGSEFR